MSTNTDTLHARIAELERERDASRAAAQAAETRATRLERALGWRSFRWRRIANNLRCRLGATVEIANSDISSLRAMLDAESGERSATNERLKVLARAVDRLVAAYPNAEHLPADLVAVQRGLRELIRPVIYH